MANESNESRGTVAFDVLGTMFSLERPRTALGAIGAPPHALDVWFAQALRDAYAWSLTGNYRPLAEVLRAALPRTLQQLGVRTAESERDTALATFRELDPVDGVREAVERLADAGWRLITLTNGSVDSTRVLLEHAGIADRFSALRSADEVGKTKPHPDVYDLAREDAEGPVWLLAAHGWDVAGAKAAGLRAAWVSALEKRYLGEMYPEPDVTAGTLTEAAEKIVGSET